MNNSRRKIIYLNSTITLLSQFLQIVVGFVIRKLFIQFIGINYLGYNSVFSNILQMMNWADMGIGVAITSFLYKPLAKHDNERIHALMYLYKKVYRFIGVFVLITGIIVSLFLPIIIPDAHCSDGYLRILFYINLLSVVASYFIAYKRTLLVADQKTFIITLLDLIIFIISSIVQIVLLVFYPNYICYLLVIVARNIISNIIVSIKCVKIYGRIGKNVSKQLYLEYKPQIVKYVKDLLVSRFGAMIYYSTDNVIISIFRGSLLTGYLSNYTLITAQISGITTQLFSSIQATYANYLTENEDKIKQRKMTDNYLMGTFMVGNYCFLCLFMLLHHFIALIFGAQYTLDMSTVLLLSINVCLTIMIQLPSQIFMIHKLYEYDKPIIVTSALLNICLSCVMVNFWGINGVLFGTLVTSLIYLFSRFFIICREVYSISCWHYYSKLIYYFLISFISLIAEIIIFSNFDGQGIISFIVRMIGVAVISVLIPAVLLMKTHEFAFIINKMISTRVNNYYSNKILLVSTLICVITFIALGYIF